MQGTTVLKIIITFELNFEGIQIPSDKKTQWNPAKKVTF